MRAFLPSLIFVPLAVLLVTLSGCDPLRLAVERGDTQTVRIVLEQGNRQDIDRNLLRAACYGYTDVARLLLYQGANVNYVNKLGGYSVLQCAAHIGRPEMVSLLLKFGANREYTGTVDMTALELAKKRGNTSAVKILEDAPATPAATPPKPLAPAPPAASSPPQPMY